MSSPLADSAFAAAQHPQMQRRTPADVADDFTRAREVMQRQTAVRRTPEAQADITAARAAPTAMEQADAEHFEHDAAAERYHHLRSEMAAEAERDAGLDAALSNAAIADTPAVREMGGPAQCPTVARVIRGNIEAGRTPGGNITLDTTHTIGGLLRSFGGPQHIEIERADLDDVIAALQVLAGTPPPGEATPVLPPGSIVLAGPEAERYRAIAAAARKAQASAATARADGAALLQLFQAFCAGLAPGKEG